MPATGSKLTKKDTPLILALDCAEAAAALRMSRTRLYAAIRNGEIASYTTGRSRRISVRALEAYQAVQEAKREGAHAVA
jgi:excisionase family DNA binding protein